MIADRTARAGIASLPFYSALVTLAVMAAAALPAPATAAGREDPENSYPVAPLPSRFSVSISEGFDILDGGYADPGHLYSSVWDTGRSTGIGARYDFTPALSAGLSAGFSEFRDSGLGLDDLHAGYARALCALSLPFEMPARFLLDGSAAPLARGVIMRLSLEAGLGVIDPTHDAYGRLFERTFTWSAAAALRVEYRLESLGLFVEFGASLLGPPGAAPLRWQTPDTILTFPLKFGLSLYLP